MRQIQNVNKDKFFSILQAVTLLVLIFYPCSGAVYANGYLDSLYREYYTAKTDTQRLNIGSLIIEQRTYQGSENYNPDSAIALLESCLALAKSKNYTEHVADLLYFKADYLQLKNEYELANSCIDSAIQIIKPLHNYEQLGHYYYVKATFYGELNLPQRCVDYVYKAIESYEKSGNKRAAGNAFFYLGQLYKKNQQFNKAEEYYLKSALLSKDSVDAGVCYVFCASMALKQNDLKKAKEYLDKSKPVLSSSVAFQPFYYYNSYGQWLKAVGNDEEALEYFTIAAEQCVKGNQRYQKPATLCRMAEIYLKQKKFNAAKNALDEATMIATEEQIGKEVQFLHSTLSKYYEAVNMPVKAFEEFKIAQALKDSSNQNQLSQSLAGSALEFEYNKKEIAQAQEQRKKDEAEAQKLRAQKLMAYSIGVVLLFVCLVSILLYRSNQQQKKANTVIVAEKRRSENLLLNILPEEVAEELKAKGTADAKLFDEVTVFFSDFKSFTTISEKLSPQQLVDELHECFSAFDKIMEKYNIEKIKTVGDAYLAVSGLPLSNANHAEDVVSAALEIQQFMADRKRQIVNRLGLYEIRVGINSGSVVAGIVGVKKFAYDIWGDTVNTAARMEQNSEAGKVNISQTTYELIKHKFNCKYRGEIEVKNKGKLKMYFIV